MRNGAYDQYKKRQVEGVDQGKLIIMLYEGAIKFLTFAKDAIEKKDMEMAHNNLVRGQAIINELINSLKVDVGEVALNLLRLYEFMNRQLSIANAQKNSGVIDGVIQLLSSLRDGWLAVIQKLNEEKRLKKESREENDGEEKAKKPVDVAV